MPIISLIIFLPIYFQYPSTVHSPLLRSLSVWFHPRVETASWARPTLLADDDNHCNLRFDGTMWRPATARGLWQLRNHTTQRQEKRALSLQRHRRNRFNDSWHYLYKVHLGVSNGWIGSKMVRPILIHLIRFDSYLYNINLMTHNRLDPYSIRSIF